MAKGFGTGLIHGGLASAAALLALALVVPLPERAAELPEAGADAVTPVDTPAQAPAETVESAGAAPEPATLQPAEAPVDAPAEPAPEAGSVNLPVGSEFARSADLAPPVPAIPDAPAAGASLTEAPAVVAPAAEPAPVSSAAPVEAPDPAAERVSVSRLTLPESEAAPDLSGILFSEAPALAAAPAGLADAAAPDDLPDPVAPPVALLPEAVVETPPAAPEPELQPEPAPEPEIAAVAPEPVAEPAPTEIMVAEPAPAAVADRPAAPGLDLSTPPDLTELNLLDRN